MERGGRITNAAAPSTERLRGRTYVIAEIGVNHDGSEARALELVAAAAASGADAVKLQIFRADRLMHASSAFAEYQQTQVSDASPQQMLRRLELSEASQRRVVSAIKAAGLDAIATPFSPEDLEIIGSLDLAAVKIASPDLVNLPLLRPAAKLGKPMLVSTGAATLDEIARTVGWLNGWDVSFTLLHCISCYPTALADARLSWIDELTMRFGLPVGFSDHTTEPLAGALAVAAGAVVIEKHLTYDRAAAGPDHAASFDPAQFAQYVSQIRLAETMRGTPGKRVLDCEQDVRRVSRQSLIVTRAMGAGERLREEDLSVQRPGTGIEAAAIDRVVGRALRQPMTAGQMLAWEMVGE